MRNSFAVSVDSQPWVHCMVLWTHRLTAQVVHWRRPNPSMYVFIKSKIWSTHNWLPSYWAVQCGGLFSLWGREHFLMLIWELFLNTDRLLSCSSAPATLTAGCCRDSWSRWKVFSMAGWLTSWLWCQVMGDTPPNGKNVSVFGEESPPTAVSTDRFIYNLWTKSKRRTRIILISWTVGTVLCCSQPTEEES